MQSTTITYRLQWHKGEYGRFLARATTGHGLLARHIRVLPWGHVYEVPHVRMNEGQWARHTPVSSKYVPPGLRAAVRAMLDSKGGQCDCRLCAKLGNRTPFTGHAQLVDDES